MVGGFINKFANTIEYFKSLDSYIENNMREFTCSDICDIYSSMNKCLQEVKGNSNGFTGLSELIIFRYLLKYIGGVFTQQAVEGSETLKEFSNGIYTVGQSCRIVLDGKRKYPDIMIKKNNEIISVIQIKVYVTNGVEEAKKEINDFKLFKSKYKNMKGFMIVFTEYGKESRIWKEFEEFSKQNTWFKSIMLGMNKNNFYNEIKEIID